MSTAWLPIMAALALAVSGCASMRVGAGAVQLKSDPAGAQITVYDKAGEAAWTGTTPATLPLVGSESPLSRGPYRIVFEAPGYHPSQAFIQGTTTGWYLGSLQEVGPTRTSFAWLESVTAGDWVRMPNEIRRTLISTGAPLSEFDLRVLQRSETRSEQPELR